MLGLLGLKVVMNSKSFASSLVTLSWLLNRREKKPRRFTYVEATFRRGKQHHRLKLVETMGHVPSTALQLVINNPRSLQAVYQVDTETWIFFTKITWIWWFFGGFSMILFVFFGGLGGVFFWGGSCSKELEWGEWVVSMMTCLVVVGWISVESSTAYLWLSVLYGRDKDSLTHGHRF